MRSRLRTFVAGLLVLGLATLSFAQDEVKTIIDKAIEAHGGEKALKSFGAGRVKSKGKLEILNGIDFTQEISYQLPGKFRDEMELEVMGQKVKTTTIFDGKKAVIEVNGKAIPLTDPIKEALKEAGDMFKIARILPLRDKEYELATLGEAQVNGKPAVGVRVSKKGQKDISLFFDKKTGLMAKVERRTVDISSGQEITEERIIAEYQKVDNMAVAKRVLVNRDGKKFLEAEILDVKMLEKLDDAEFNIP